MGQITPDNWNYCSYGQGDQKAFISIGAEIRGEKFLENYFVTLRDQSRESDLFQKTFLSVDAACLFINRQYSHLEFTDLTISKGGCDTCGKS